MSAKRKLSLFAVVIILTLVGLFVTTVAVPNLFATGGEDKKANNGAGGDLKKSDTSNCTASGSGNCETTENPDECPADF